MTEHKLICPWCGDCRHVEALSPNEHAKTIKQVCARCSSERNPDHQSGYDKYTGHHSNPWHR